MLWSRKEGGQSEQELIVAQLNEQITECNANLIALQRLAFYAAGRNKEETVIECKKRSDAWQQHKENLVAQLHEAQSQVK